MNLLIRFFCWDYTVLFYRWLPFFSYVAIEFTFLKNFSFIIIQYETVFLHLASSKHIWKVLSRFVCVCRKDVLRKPYITELKESTTESWINTAQFVISFTLQRIKCFPSTLCRRNFRDAIVFEKLRFLNGFCQNESEKRPAFLNFSSVKSFFWKLWTD